MLAWLAALPLLVASEAPSVVVLSLHPEEGVSAGAAALLTENLTQLVRDWGTFSRVVAFREVQETLNLERQKQLLSCESDSCLAEIGGALGVELLLTGSVGRLGQATLVNIKLLRTRTSELVSSVFERVDGPVDRALDLLPYAVGQLLWRAKLMKPNLVPPARSVAAAPVPTAPGRPAARPAPLADDDAHNVDVTDGPRPVILGAGGVVLVLGGLSFLAAALATAAALVVVVVPVVVPVMPLPGMSLNDKKQVFLAGGGGLATLGALGVVLAVGLLVGGVATLRAGL